MTRARSDQALGTLLLALAASLLILAGTVYAARRVTRAESQRRTELTQSELGWVMLEFEKTLDHHADVMLALADSVATRGPQWMRAVSPAALGPGLQFRAVVLLDSGFVVRESAPFDARMLPVLAADDDAARARGLKDALLKAMTPDVVVTPTVDLGERGRQIVVAARLGPQARPTGYVAGVIRARDLFDAVLDRTRKRGFEVTVGEGSLPLYGPEAPERQPGDDYGSESAITNGPVLWSVRLWPSEDALRRADSWGPRAVLWLGGALAFCVGFLILLATARLGAAAAAAEPAGSSEPPIEAPAPPALAPVRSGPTDETDPVSGG